VPPNLIVGTLHEARPTANTGLILNETPRKNAFEASCRKGCFAAQHRSLYGL